MPALLARSESFALDVERQVDWLEDASDLVRLRRFGAELRELETLISDFPELGVVVLVGGVEFRKALFRKLPFVVWYRYDAARDQVQVLRLFHAHQDRPTRRRRRRPRRTSGQS